METEKDLTLELKDDLGEIELIKCVAPGIFYVVAADPGRINNSKIWTAIIKKNKPNTLKQIVSDILTNTPSPC